MEKFPRPKLPNDVPNLEYKLGFDETRESQNLPYPCRVIFTPAIFSGKLS